MDDIVKKALGKVSRFQDNPVAAYQDVPHPLVDRVSWRPLEDVHQELGGLPEIPDYIHDFGEFMHKMAAKAAGPGLTSRDLIKAYVITRSSIGRSELPSDTLRKNGLELPSSVGKMIRPEGAMAEWLKSPMGQRYLDASEVGKVDPEAVDHAQKVMRSFGLTNKCEGQALPWAVQNLAGRHELVSNLVKAGLNGTSPAAEWRNWATKLYGIKDAKAGFIGSMVGRGDAPTLDAREVVLNTGMSTDDVGSKLSGPAGAPAVERLTDRLSAMNPRLDPGLEPFRPHLGHHAVWDKAENARTTHSDLMDTMLHAATGGRIGKAGGGSKGGGSAEEQRLQMLLHAMAAMGPNHNFQGLDQNLIGNLKGGSTQEVVQRALKLFQNSGSFVRTGSGLLRANPGLSKVELSGIPEGQKHGNLRTPLGEMEAEYLPKHNLEPFKRLDIDKLLGEGAYLVPFIGDRTPADTILRSINGVPTGDINQPGGGDYMRSKDFNTGPDATGWRSRGNIPTSYSKKIQEYAQKGPLVGMHVAMGIGSADSSHMVLHSILNQINHLPIKSDDIKEFDDHIEKYFPPSDAYPMKWPGIKNTQKAHDFFYNQPDTNTPRRPGTDVSGFVQRVDHERWRRMGFPDVASIRFANTHPALLGTESGTTGYSATRLDPSGQLVGNTENLYHHSYDRGYKTLGYEGGLDAPIPASEVWHKDFEGMPPLDKRGNPVNYSDPESRGKIIHTLMTRFPAVKMDTRIADAMHKANEVNEPYQRAKGGKVKKTKNMERAMSLTSLYALDHDRDAG
jgi:hypothetical protein